MAAPVALIALFGLGLLAAYSLRDRTASSPAPQTLTVTATPKTPNPADAPDNRFLAALASYGIADNGTESVRQRFMEFGHHTCFTLLPPKPQPLAATVSTILTEENNDVVAGNPWSPKFTYDDAEHLAQAAIGAYCPDVPR
ncbi:hypothetical protein AWC20_07695 [Mycobacterium parmense]|nr:hypothetical protein AWC20_07695 [Mycobacterium parmense]